MNLRNACVNKLFIDKVAFQNIHSDYLKVTDLSKEQKPDGESLFIDSVVFSPEEKRSYLFWL